MLLYLRNRVKNSGIRAYFFVILVILLIFLLVYILSDILTARSALSLAVEIAQPRFVQAYVTLLCAVTAIGVVRWEVSLAHERSESHEIIRILTSSDPADLRLRMLNKRTDARININRYCREDESDPAERKAAQASTVRRAVAAFIGAAVSVPPLRHIGEGIRPASGILNGELRRGLPRTAEFGDFVIRMALLGTFTGIIAALTIASANVGGGENTGTGDAARMQAFLQVLLGSAAAKFWISAVGLALALLLRAWQMRIDSAANSMAYDLGRAFDDELMKPDVSEAWCPLRSSELDPITEQIHAIADQIKKSANKWKLVIELGADPASQPATVKLATDD